ncbi:MAG: hypothetical protein ABI467_11935 [Kofleriaceae bacterium]
MSCARCGAEATTKWCTACERLYDTWSRQYASDILWQTGTGAVVAMVFGLGAPLLGFSPLLGIMGVLVGFTTFMGLRRWNDGRRRHQYLTASVPRAYLP